MIQEKRLLLLKNDLFIYYKMKLSPNSHKRYSIFNDSINIRTSRNTSFDYEF